MRITILGWMTVNRWLARLSGELMVAMDTIAVSGAMCRPGVLGLAGAVPGGGEVRPRLRFLAGELGVV